MVAEVIVRKWCDRHNADGTHVEADTYLLSLDGKTTREVDLCRGCVEEYLLPLSDLVASVGRRAVDSAGNTLVIGGGKAPGRPRKDAPAKVVPGVAGTPGPVWVTPVLDGPLDVGPDVAATCPVCEMQAKTWRSFAIHLRRQHEATVGWLFGTVCPLDGQETDNGLGGHAARGHGGMTTLQVFEAAQREQDPHGIAWEFRERAASLREVGAA